jgi:ABC-2 type transport system permease protein
MSKLAELSQSRELILNLTLRELRGKYKRSFLGWTWSLLNPISTMAIYWLVFGVILKIVVPPGEPSGLDVFPLFLLCGLLPWNFLSNGMTGGMEALVGNSNLIKKVYFPREVLTLSIVSSVGFTFCIEMSVLGVALLLVGNMVLPWLPLVIMVMALQMVFVTGIALLLSVLNVYFRDVRHLIGILLSLWFYLTPIVYPVTFVPEHTEILGFDVPARFLYSLNPMVGFTEVYRDLLYNLRFPSWGQVAYITGAAIVALVFGQIVFGRLEGRLAEEL